MDLQTLATADYLDIVFDNRNKTYGGYQLRRTYGQRIKKAVAILYSILTGIALYALLHKPQTVVSTIKKDWRCTLATVDPIEIPIVPQPPAPPKQPQTQARPRLRTELFTDPIITTEVVPEDKRMANNDALKNMLPGTAHNADGDSASIDDYVEKKRGEGFMPIEKKPNTPVPWVEQMPAFNGDLTGYLSKHVRYPDAAREFNIQGRVVVRFVVNEDGSISDAAIVKGIGGGCDEEAMRVVAAMPRWKPGRQNGNPVKVYFQLPILFMLQ